MINDIFSNICKNTKRYQNEIAAKFDPVIFDSI